MVKSLGLTLAISKKEEEFFVLIDVLLSGPLPIREVKIAQRGKAEE